MHRACLTGLPDERGNGVAAERIGREQMPAITIRPAFTLRVRQQAGFPGQVMERRAHAKRESRRGRIEAAGLIECFGQACEG